MPNVSNQNKNFSADVILDDSHKLTGRYAIVRTSNDDGNGAIMYGGGTFFNSELRLGDVVLMTGPKETGDPEDANVSYTGIVDNIVSDYRFDLIGIKE